MGSTQNSRILLFTAMPMRGEFTCTSTAVGRSKGMESCDKLGWFTCFHRCVFLFFNLILILHILSNWPLVCVFVHTSSKRVPLASRVRQRFPSALRYTRCKLIFCDSPCSMSGSTLTTPAPQQPLSSLPQLLSSHEDLVTPRSVSMQQNPPVTAVTMSVFCCL